VRERHEATIYVGRGATAKKKKGLIIVNIGDGKGNTTAALGVALRACGAKPGILEIANLAMEMRLLKHPFEEGSRRRKESNFEDRIDRKRKSHWRDEREAR